MALIWKPDNDVLQQIVFIVQNPNTLIDEQQLTVLCQYPDFSLYLLYVLAKLSSEDEKTRCLSALMLKRVFERYYQSLPPEVQTYIKEVCLSNIGDPVTSVRAALGVVICTICRVNGLTHWPELLPTLCKLIDSEDEAICKGSLETIDMLDEEISKYQSDEDNSVIDAVITKCLKLFNHKETRIRSQALVCVKNLIYNVPLIWHNHKENLLLNIFQLAIDDDLEIRKNICAVFVNLLEEMPADILPYMDQIIEYMLVHTRDSNELVALEACEFWLVLSSGDIQICMQVLRPYLKRLLPILLNGMKYSLAELYLLRKDFEEGSIIFDMPVLVECNEENEDTCDEWNLRKCSAASLDHLATKFSHEIFSYSLPILKDCLYSHDWRTKEMAILALGAIKEGCMLYLTPHIPELITHLFDCLESDNALICCITCWTMSRYSEWIVSRNDELKRFVCKLLEKAQDSNERIQEGACSALAILEEHGLKQLTPFIEDILQVLMASITKYRKKNHAIVYDAIGTLADAVSTELNKHELVEKLVPLLLEKWESLKEDDKEIPYLLECLSSVVSALKSGFLPYAPLAFQRSVNLIDRVLSSIKDTSQTGNEDILVGPLELLSGMTEGLGSDIEPLVTGSNVVLLLLQCMTISDAAVLQSSFALLGDLARACFQHIKPNINDFITLITTNLLNESTSSNACSNATWALGEITLQVGADMSQYLPSVLPNLIMRINDTKTQEIFCQNIAGTLGRLGFVCPNEIAPHLGEFYEQWFDHIGNFQDNEERDSSFRGICVALLINVEPLLNNITPFCTVITSLDDSLKSDLIELISKILIKLRSTMDDNHWQTLLTLFPARISSKIFELVEQL